MSILRHVKHVSPKRQKSQILHKNQPHSKPIDIGSKEQNQAYREVLGRHQLEVDGQEEGILMYD